MAKVRKPSKENYSIHSGKHLSNTIGVVGEYKAKDYSAAFEAGKSVGKKSRPGVVKISGDVSIGYNKNTGIILVDAAQKPENRMTSLEKWSAVRAGVSKRDLESLKTKTRLDYGKLAKALSVTRATLINKKNQQKFNTALSERIISLADIYSYGYEVFEDEDRFNQWMFRPNQALNGQVPYELMDNQFGREEVRNIIGRIDYGVYS